MKSSDISPVFYSVSAYKYNYTKKSAMKLCAAKNQYVYRCLYFTEGGVDVTICGEVNRCSDGDVLFLVPGEEYSIKATKDFSLIDLFFDIDGVSVSQDRNVSTCVSAEEFTPSLCSPKPHISDGAVLRHNRIFKNVAGAHIFTELLERNGEDVYFDLFAKIALSQLIYNLLVSEERKKNVGADRIISYINSNATLDLSAQLLEKKFGYHRNYINKLLKEQTGRTLTQCIRRSKINYAKALIAEARIPQTQIAKELGYYDYSHFYKAFMSETGMSPSDIA